MRMNSAAVAFERIADVEVDDALALPVLDPVIAWHLAVVLIGFAVALLPAVELAPSDTDPSHHLLDLHHLRQLGQPHHEIHHLVASIMGNPLAAQSSPSSFFSATYSSVT